MKDCIVDPVIIDMSSSRALWPVGHPSVLTDYGTHEIYHVCMPGDCRYGGAVVSHASRSPL